jgi:hypothetical protein
VDLTDLKNLAVCQEWDNKQDLIFRKHVFEQMKRIDYLLWEIGQVCFECFKISSNC